MKLLLLPLRDVTSKKLFLYGTALKAEGEISPSVSDRIVNKAASTWLSWEAAEKGWKKKIVELGNKAITRIDYREHSLKSIMSERAYRRYYPNSLTSPVQLNHPKAVDKSFITSELKTLAREGHPRHRQWFIYSLVLMPFTAPFMLIPVVPNIPFFYVAFRAWSHYRAMEGSKHLNLLLDQDRITYSASSVLDDIYSKDGKMDSERLLRTLKDRLPAMTAEVQRANLQLERREAELSSPSVSAEEIAINRSRSRTGLHK